MAPNCISLGLHASNEVLLVDTTPRSLPALLEARTDLLMLAMGFFLSLRTWLHSLPITVLLLADEL